MEDTSEDWYMVNNETSTNSTTDYPKPLAGSMLVIFWAFAVFFAVKTVLFDKQFILYIKRYWDTYSTLNQVEIWIMLVTAVKVTVVVPDYFLNEINWLFWVFIVNSLVTFWLSHLLHMRACMARNGSRCEARSFIALFAFRLLLIPCIIFLGPKLDNVLNLCESQKDFIILECRPSCPYPIRFVLIFLLDFISATFDFIVFLLSPKTDGSKQRLKEMRVATIDAAVDANIRNTMAARRKEP